MQVLETLGLNVPGFLWHTVNFLVLVYLLSRFLYHPVVKLLDERAARVRESMERAELIRQEAERAAEERAAMMAAARREIEELRAQAERQLEAYRSQRRQEIDAEIQRMLSRAEADIRSRQDQMIAELRQQVADLAVAAAERVIRQRLDADIQRRLVEEFLAERTAGNGAR